MLNRLPEPLALPMQNKHHQILRSWGLHSSPALAETPCLSLSRASQSAVNRPLLTVHLASTRLSIKTLIQYEGPLGKLIENS